MSVAEVFLRGGTPSTSLSQLSHELTTHYTHWRWCIVVPRQWALDAQHNRLSCPAFHLVFGATSTGSNHKDTNDDDDEAAQREWHLFFADVQPVCTQTSAAYDVVASVLRAVPVGLHPRSFVLCVAVHGSTHARLGLYSASAWRSLCARVQAQCMPVSVRTFASVLVADGQARCTLRTSAAADTGNVDDEDDKCRAMASRQQAFVDNVLPGAVQWLCECSGHALARPVCGPRQHGDGDDDAALLRLLSELNPLLWTTRYVAPDAAAAATVGSGVAGVDRNKSAATAAASSSSGVDVESLSGTAKLRAMRDEARLAWRRKTGEYAAFALPPSLLSRDDDNGDGGGSSSTGADADAMRYTAVFLLQRPYVHKRAVDLDNRDVGPREPQPVAAELHLLPDAGDVAYVAQQMQNTSTIDFVYDDYLHEDGEVLVQLVPVEGVAFDDLDRMLDVVAPLSNGGDSADAAASAVQPPAVCEGSCSGYVYPRVVRRVPTSAVAKAHRLARTRGVVCESSPTPGMLRVAAAALRYVSSHVVRLQPTSSPSSQQRQPQGDNNKVVAAGGYTLALQHMLPLPTPPHCCTWCSRMRTRLQRCTSCKAVLYCCKSHQVLDWKDGNHKTECAQWRIARELAEQQLMPYVAAQPARERRGGGDDDAVRDKGWSCAACLLDFVPVVAATVAAAAARTRDDAAQQQQRPPLYVYVMGIGQDCLTRFLQCLAQQLSAAPELCAAWQVRVLLLSDTFTAEQRNAVWAIHTADATAVVLPGTGVLGDVWHTARDTAASQPPALLVRLCNTKYYLYEQDKASSTHDNSSSSSQHDDNDEPHGVLSFGPSDGSGLDYFSASLEHLASRVVGARPVRWVESSYVGTSRTQRALAMRVAHSDVCAAHVKKCFASDTLRQRCAPMTIVLNETRMCLQRNNDDDDSKDTDDDTTTRSTAAAASTTMGNDKSKSAAQGAGEVERSRGAAMRGYVYVNAFYFDVLPFDKQCNTTTARTT